MHPHDLLRHISLIKNKKIKFALIITKLIIDGHHLKLTKALKVSNCFIFVQWKLPSHRFQKGLV